MNINHDKHYLPDQTALALVPVSQAAGQSGIIPANTRFVNRENLTDRLQEASFSAEQAFELSHAITSRTVHCSLLESGRTINETDVMKREHAEAIISDVRKQEMILFEQLTKGLSEKTSEEQLKVIQLMAQAKELFHDSASKAINTLNEKVIDQSINTTLQNYQQLAKNAINLQQRFTSTLERQQMQAREREEYKRHLEETRSDSSSSDDALSRAHSAVREVLANIDDQLAPATETDEASAQLQLQKLTNNHHEHLALIESFYPPTLRSYVSELLNVQRPYMVEEDGVFQIFPGVIRLRN